MDVLSIPSSHLHLPLLGKDVAAMGVFAGSNEMSLPLRSNSAAANDQPPPPRVVSRGAVSTIRTTSPTAPAPTACLACVSFFFLVFFLVSFLLFLVILGYSWLIPFSLHHFAFSETKDSNRPLSAPSTSSVMAVNLAPAASALALSAFMWHHAVAIAARAGNSRLPRVLP
jgi:hypothetical protein